MSTLRHWSDVARNKPFSGGCVVAAKSAREWVAFYGGEELGVSVDVASTIWEAATKAAEERFTSRNKAMPKCSCGREGTRFVCTHCYGEFELACG
jgi:hypothetical protein